MNKIEYRKGDLLSVTDGIIAHGCNCQGVMGSGVAKAIRDKYPTAYNYYKYVSNNPGLCLGRIQVVEITSHLKIVNMLTQEFYGKDGKKYVSYDAVDSAFANLFARNMRNLPVNIPKIGSGLGGGDWYVIESIIESRMKQYEDQVVICWEL